VQYGRIARALLCLTFAAATLVCGPSARSQDSALAPAAQDAMEHGLAAAQLQNYKLAYQYFLDAQKANPGSAPIWFNLGLAAAKVPGHEFRAIAWLKAYLLANPDAKNAGAIGAQITNLEVVFEERLGKVVDALEPVTKAIADVELIDPAGLGADGRYEARLTSGGLLAAMRFYLGDVNGGQKTRQRFGIGKGNVHNHMTSKIYGHFDRGLASAGLYDELISNDWFSGDSALPNQAPDGALFAIERGDYDAAERMYKTHSTVAIRHDIVCELVELGRLDDAQKSVDRLFYKDDQKDFGASREKWFDANCSGWWLKKGAIDRLVARGRGGQAITVWRADNHDAGVVARFADTSIVDWLASLKKYVALKAKFHSASESDLSGSLDSLADLFESYRQMRGPYGR
jgi:tetratricopeptide (TPR) repeat protein